MPLSGIRVLLLLVALLAPQNVKRATEVLNRHVDSLMTLPAVAGAAVAESRRRPGEAAIVLYLSRELKPKERRKVPRTLEGIPVETEVSGPFKERERKR